MRRIIPDVIIIMCLPLLTVAVLLNMGWRGGDGRWHSYEFIDLTRQGWFSFVLARFVGLYLIVLLVRRLWRWSHRIGISAATLLIIGFAVFSVVKSYSPDGIYCVVGEMAKYDDHYFLFAAGKVEDIHPDTRLRYGHYEKTADGWVVITNDEEPYTEKLKFSVFGIYLTKADNPEPSFWPRRIIPFLRPSWIPDWLQ